MALDYRLTGLFYDDNVTVLLDEDSDIQYNLLPEDFVFICRRCGYTKNIKVSDIIKHEQEKVCKFLLHMRLDAAYKLTDKTKVDEASGVSFCGMCKGVVDDSGYCYNDVILQCPVRKKIINEENFSEREKYKK